ncbi:hypothetical protein EON67_08480 [archaeon]|nr:MAG: hypothetical protein EON67_08480 [archaeon]
MCVFPPTRTVALQFTFWSLHWKRGSPFWEDQGEYLDRTMWEQIDNGVPWTNARKFLMIVPIVLYVPLAARLPPLPHVVATARSAAATQTRGSFTHARALVIQITAHPLAAAGTS